MSYAKAMKHARNVRKTRAQARMHFGFDSCTGKTPAARSYPEIGAMLNIGEWFAGCHRGDAARRQHMRECIREQIDELRSIRANQTGAAA